MTIDSIGEKVAPVVKEWWREMIVVAWFILAFLIHYDWVQGITFEAMFFIALSLLGALYPSLYEGRKAANHPFDWHRKMNDDQSYSSRYPYRSTPGNCGGELPPRFDDSWSVASMNSMYNTSFYPRRSNHDDS